MNFKHVLDDLVASLPDIYDGFICNADRGIIASSLSLIKETSDCMDIFRRTEKLLAMGRVHYQDINKFTFCFDHTVLLAYPLQQDTWLFLTHSQELAPGLVRGIIDATIPSLGGMQAEPANAIPVEAEAPAKASVQESTTVNPEVEVVDIASLTRPDGALHEPLKKIEKALAKVVGPIGTVILEDALLSWSKEYSPGLDTLDQLYPFLEQELDDESQNRKFTLHLDSMA